MADPRLYGWQGLGATSQSTEGGIVNRNAYDATNEGFLQYLTEDQGYQMDPDTGRLRLRNTRPSQNEYDMQPEWMEGGASNLRLENGNRGFFENGQLTDSGERWTDQQDSSGFGGFMDRYALPLLIAAAGGLIASQGGFAAASQALGGSGGMSAGEIAGMDLSGLAGSVPDFVAGGGSGLAGGTQVATGSGLLSNITGGNAAGGVNLTSFDPAANTLNTGLNPAGSSNLGLQATNPGTSAFTEGALTNLPNVAATGAGTLGGGVAAGTEAINAGLGNTPAGNVFAPPASTVPNIANPNPVQTGGLQPPVHTTPVTPPANTTPVTPTGPSLPGIVSGVTNLAFADWYKKYMEDLLKKSDPFGDQRSRYFEPTAGASQMLTDSQNLAMRGLNDPTFWDQSWLNDAAERAGSDTQRKLAAQGYNMAGNTPLEMSKNMRDTRAQYILPGQQNLISNVQANTGAVGAQGNLAGAQFNPGNAAWAFMQGAANILPIVNQGTGSLTFGSGANPTGGGPSLNDALSGVSRGAATATNWLSNKGYTPEDIGNDPAKAWDMWGNY